MHVLLALALLAPMSAPPPKDAHKKEADEKKFIEGHKAEEDLSTIVWLHDDWAKAKADATEAHRLVAIDVWATWCHSCLSMKHYVFTDKSMAKVAKQHTWVALDFDKPDNAAFFAKFPVSAFPTFLVIDPASETVV